MYQNRIITTHIKLILILFIIKIFTLDTFCKNSDIELNDSIVPDTSNHSIYDVSLYENKELQIYLYHVNALLEYQEHQIQKYTSIIYILMGVIAIMITVIVLNKISKYYERSFKVVKVKKREIIPAAILKMLFKHWSIKESFRTIQSKLFKKEGETLFLNEFIDIGSNYGIDFYVIKGTLQDMMSSLDIPLIVLFTNHMAVLYKTRKEKILIADAFYGYLELDPYYFVNSWFTDKNKETGVFIAPVPGKIQNKKTQNLLERLDKLNKVDKRSWKQYALL